MTTLLLAEHDHGTLKDATNKALTAATQLGGKVHVLVAGGGEGTKAAAEAAAKLAGVKKLCAEYGPNCKAPVYLPKRPQRELRYSHAA